MFPSTWMSQWSISLSGVLCSNQQQKRTLTKQAKNTRKQKRGSISDADTKRHVNRCDYHSNRNIGPHHPYVQCSFSIVHWNLYIGYVGMNMNDFEGIQRSQIQIVLK